jgi:hypothetical protein
MAIMPLKMKKIIELSLNTEEKRVVTTIQNLSEEFKRF